MLLYIGVCERVYTTQAAAVIGKRFGRTINTASHSHQHYIFHAIICSRRRAERKRNSASLGPCLWDVPARNYTHNRARIVYNNNKNKANVKVKIVIFTDAVLQNAPRDLIFSTKVVC